MIGGTGMLATATRWLAPRTANLTLAARRPFGLAAEVGAAAMPLDWADRPAALRALAMYQATQGPADLLVSWLHDDAVWLAEPAEACLAPGARSIRVHGANSIDSAVQRKRDPAPRPDVLRQTVILGWHHDPEQPDRQRWLSDDEISGGVIDALRTPGATRLILGDGHRRS